MKTTKESAKRKRTRPVDVVRKRDKDPYPPLLVAIKQAGYDDRVVEFADPRVAFCREFNVPELRRLGITATPIKSCRFDVWIMGESKPAYSSDCLKDAQDWIDVWTEGPETRMAQIIPAIEGGEA